VSVPLGRYFVVVGSFLLVLLLALNWYLPNPSPMQSYGSPIDGAILHIQSETKWPQRLQFDTAAPAILPPSPAVAVATASEDPKLDAFAEARPPEKQPEKQVVVKPKTRVATRHRRQLPEPLHFAVNPTPSTWPPSW
jgi:hypothetical protein